ncbi:unnamed protein product [Microthlaspi erraticum]|uniref:Bulb-type lectin domain-containing protein n=1 Tax=Microthlaspi erraticum TaxID=1685480 RepID=A0A6D2KF07_9BRAS|nr:unnamed protein product [Microthlaspi erraticum]
MDSHYKMNMFLIISIYGFLMMFLPLQISCSTDTISTNQSLSGDQTLVSSGGVFELGLFLPGNSRSLYLGIWYNRTRMSFHGLIIWSSAGFDSPSGVDVQMVLLDNGNLVLRDGNNSILWQSFDNPSDTWLPGAKIRLANTDLETRGMFLTSWNALDDPSLGRYSLRFDHDGKENSLVIFTNGTKPYWSSGAWDDRLRIFRQVRFNGNLSFEFNLSESYVTYSVRNQNLFRFVMDVSGQLMAYSWLEKQKIWESSWSAPEELCMIYGYCGSFGICHDNSSCTCAPSFRRPLLQGSNDSSAGCISEFSVDENQCGEKDDKFLPLENMKLASDPEERDP